MEKQDFFFKISLLIIFIFFYVSGFIPTAKKIYSSPVVDDNQSVETIIRYCSLNQNSIKLNKKRLPKGFDYNLHIYLLENFPDWDERVNYQTNQYKLYRQAQLKLKQMPFTVVAKNQYLTYNEKQALDYFCGDGNFEKWQHYSVEPNIFDTRQTFIIKMQNSYMRTKFLNSWDHYYENEKNLNPEN